MSLPSAHGQTPPPPTAIPYRSAANTDIRQTIAAARRAQAQARAQGRHPITPAHFLTQEPQP